MGSRVLVYPGQFDPFHRDHLAELRGALRSGEQAVVVPVASPRGAAREQTAPHRLRMDIAREMVGADSRIRVDGTSERERLLYAPDIVDGIRGEDSRRYALLLGSDNFRSISTWRHAVRLLDGTDLVVNQRPGFEVSDPRELLPEARKSAYIRVSEQLYLNPVTDTTIELRAIPSRDTSSWGVVQALHGANAALGELMPSARARALMTSGYYAQLDLDHKTTVYEFSRQARPVLNRVLGSVWGGELSLDRDFMETLRTIPRNARDRAARVGSAVLEAAARSPGGLTTHPHAYSAGIALSLDPELRGLLRATDPTRSVRRTSDGMRSSAVSFVREKLGPMLKAAESGLLRRAVGNAGTEPLTPNPYLKGTELEVYIGLAPHVDIEAIRLGGVLSPLEREAGREAHDRALEHESRQAREHVLGRGGAFVSASLDPEVAKSYADAGGHLLVARVAASELVITNDPSMWRGTGFEEHGNPEAFLHEVLSARIAPEQIRRIEPVQQRDDSAVTLSDYIRSRLAMMRAAFTKRADAR